MVYMYMLEVVLFTILLARGLANEGWQDTEITTRVWKYVSEGDVSSLKALAYDYPEALSARSSDGRGALWWAYEYRQPEVVAYLENAGVDTTLRDADGKRPSELVDGVGETKFMKRVREQKEAEAEKSWKRYQEAQVVLPDEEEDDDEDWEEYYDDDEEGDILDEDYNDEL